MDSTIQNDPGGSNGNPDSSRADVSTSSSSDPAAAAAVAEADSVVTSTSRESIASSAATAVRSGSNLPKPVSQAILATLDAPLSTASPLASREPSPARSYARSTAASRTSSVNSGTRSRKNSQQDLSPSRPPRSLVSVPLLSSAAPKVLSLSTIPPLLPAATDPNIKTPVPTKSPTTAEHLRESPRWPVSPRLRSPPPILHKPNTSQPRKPEPETPHIHVQHASPSPQLQPQTYTHTQAAAVDTQSESEAEDLYLQSGMRTPARGASGSTSTLETVQEASPIGSPGPREETVDARLDDSLASDVSSQLDSAELRPSRSFVARSPAGNESPLVEGSSPVPEPRPSAASTAPPPLRTRLSSASVKPSKGKGGEASLQSMTVETETVTSIPQVALAAGSGGQGAGGTLRTKPSSETIRPKKDRKKPSWAKPAVSAGTASSKADIFEAKVASAVEEHNNSSDSEETFVYDSNPPDGRDRPHRFHSRTPSATSMMSQVDRTGMRSIHTIMDNNANSNNTNNNNNNINNNNNNNNSNNNGTGVTAKKNMKFVNSYNSMGNDSGLGDEDGKGTGRSNLGSGRGTARHHHFGASRRNGSSNGHPSLFADQSPFSVSWNPSSNQPRLASRPPSPRGSNARWLVNGKRGTHLAAGYDLDDTTTGADDEHTPLIPTGTVRSMRSGRTRRNMHGMRPSMGQPVYRSPPSVLNRFASCLVLTVMLLLVISGAIGFMFATSQPLTDIKLTGMENIVASEQELMLDLTVKAHNPNVVVVVIDSADIEVFAKSSHAGTDSEWWRDGPRQSTMRKRGARVQAPDGALPPVDDKAPNMRLGTITGFDSSLSFEGSFFHQGVSTSTGEVRLQRPGNGTDGGSQRWERILDDDFDLILKGVLRYTLPLSQHVRTAAVSGRKTVKPNAANNPSLQPNGTDPGEAFITPVKLLGSTKDGSDDE